MSDLSEIIRSPYATDSDKKAAAAMKARIDKIHAKIKAAKAKAEKMADSLERAPAKRRRRR